MATVAFTDASVRTVKDVSVADKRAIKILPDHSSSKIKDLDFISKNIETVSYPIAKPINEKIKTKVESVLPFRVQFTSLVVEGYTAKRPAPIGIAIVGVNNYIL